MTTSVTFQAIQPALLITYLVLQVIGAGYWFAKWGEPHMGNWTIGDILCGALMVGLLYFGGAFAGIGWAPS